MNISFLLLLSFLYFIYSKCKKTCRIINYNEKVLKKIKIIFFSFFPLILFPDIFLSNASIFIMYFMTALIQIFLIMTLNKDKNKSPSFWLYAIIILSNILTIMFTLLCIMGLLVLYLDGTASPTDSLALPEYLPRLRNFISALYITFNANKFIVIFLFIMQFYNMFITYYFLSNKYLQKFSDILVKVGIVLTILSFSVEIFSEEIYEFLNDGTFKFGHDELSDLLKNFFQLNALCQIIIGYMSKKKIDKYITFPHNNSQNS